MTRTVATRPRSRTLHLQLFRGSSWTKLQALCFHGKALSVMEAIVEVLFTLTTIILRPLKLEFDDVVIKHNYGIRGKYPEKRTCSPTRTWPFNMYRVKVICRKNIIINLRRACAARVTVLGLCIDIIDT